jgi:hypothetical protein
LHELRTSELTSSVDICPAQEALRNLSRTWRGAREDTSREGELNAERVSSRAAISMARVIAAVDGGAEGGGGGMPYSMAGRTQPRQPCPGKSGAVSLGLGETCVRPRSFGIQVFRIKNAPSKHCYLYKNTGGSRDTRDRCGPVLGRLYSTAAPPCRAAADRAERRQSPDTARDPRGERERGHGARHAVWYGAKPGPYRRGGVHVAGLERVSSSGGDGHGDAAWIRIVTRRRSRTGPHARRGEHLSTCMCGRHEAHRSPPGVTLASLKGKSRMQVLTTAPLRGKSRMQVLTTAPPQG